MSSLDEATCPRTDDNSCAKAVPFIASSLVVATCSRADDNSCAKAVSYIVSAPLIDERPSDIVDRWPVDLEISGASHVSCVS